MPRIRKKTSNRQNTRDRAKITKKVAEHKRKTKRNAKKDVTWKSKKRVDPGVPSTFPYKDRVLAELAEEKRRNEEAKQARREANKAKLDEPEDDTPGIASLPSSSVLTASASLGADGEDADDVDADEADIPDLVDTALATLQDVIDKADVVVQVLDARDIQGGRSEFVEKMVTDAGGKFALIVNKIDLVPRETLAGWLPHLPVETYLFSSKLPVDPSPSTFPGRSELLAAFQRWSTSRPSSDEPLTIALMGLPNVGKSSLLNALLPSSAAKQATAPIYPTAAAAKNPQPTTLRPVEVVVNAGEGVKVHVIDTPGWEHADDDDEEEDEEDEEEKDWDALQEQVVSDMLRRNLGRIDRVKDVLPLVEYIFKRSDAQDLMLAYNVPYFTAGDLDAFLTALARANGRVRKHGDADIEGAARIVVRDWATGAFPYYVRHPTTPSTISGERADVSAVLDKCKTRKELRAVGKGLIKFKGGEIDTREVILDDDFIAMADPSDDEEDEEDGDELDGEDDEDEDEEDDDEEEDEEGLVIGLNDGEELELEDGPEPSSGSDVEEEDDDDDDSDEEEVVEKSPTPPPAKISAAGKRKRKSDVSVVAAPKKAKRVSFGKNEVRVMKEFPIAKGQNKRKRG